MSQRRRFVARSSMTITAFSTLVMLGTASLANAEQKTPVDYMQHCAACHGESGKGDGIMAENQKTPPSDLTQIAKKNGGTFPIERIKKTVSGTLDDRTIARVHGPKDMPVWGKYFHDDAGSSAIAEARISTIVDYLKSIQQK